MRDDEVVDAVDKAEKDLLQMKSAQRIAADSWKVYRYVGSYLPPANTKTYLIFRTDNDLLATVKLNQESWVYQVADTGIINGDNSLYFWAMPILSDPDPLYPIRYVINSTQRGTITFSTTPPA